MNDDDDDDDDDDKVYILPRFKNIEYSESWSVYNMFMNLLLYAFSIQMVQAWQTKTIY